jgi:iron(III) transport system permease protein
VAGIDTLPAPVGLPPGEPDGRPGWVGQLKNRARSMQLGWQTVFGLLAAVVVAYLVVVPIGTMIYASLRSGFLSGGSESWTLDNFRRVLTSSEFYQIAGNSFEYAGLVAVFAVAAGFGLAWIYVRTNTPAKRFALFASMVPMVIPGLLNTVAWIELLGRNNGPVNDVLSAIGLPKFDVYSLTGMVLIQSIHVVPIAFLMGVAAFTSMDQSLEEASAACGARPAVTTLRVTFPLLLPSIISGMFLVFIETISAFEVAQLVGTSAHRRVFSAEVFSSLQRVPADYGYVAVIGVLMLIITSIGLFLSRKVVGSAVRATITGKAFRSTPLDIGRWRIGGVAAIAVFFVIAVLLPLLMLGWSSLLPEYKPPSIAALHEISLANYRSVFDSSELTGALTHSVEVAVIAALIVTVLTTIVGYVVVKGKGPGRGALEALASAPIAVPSIIMGVAVLYWYLIIPVPIHLYGTLAILVVACVTGAIPYGLRFVLPGLIQISDELEEAAQSSGASWLALMRRVTLPLLAPSLVAAFIYSFVWSFREVSASVLLYSPSSETVSVAIFNHWSDGDFRTVSALGTIMVALLVICVTAVSLIGRRFGIRTTNIESMAASTEGGTPS